MKKILCVLLAVVMLFSGSVSIAAAKNDSDDTPVILITGFLQTNLQYEKEDGTFERVWFPDIMENLHIVGKNLPDVISSVFDAFEDNPERLGETLMSTLSDLMPMMKCNPDGTSVHPVQPYENDPAKRNFAAIKNSKEPLHMQAYHTFVEHLSKNGYADESNIFMFEYDSRKDAVTLADELREFVKAVKSYTGKDKVKLFGVSYGGQIAEAYLHFYLDDGDVEKAVFNAPSFLGTNFADRLLNGEVEFALDDVMDIVESITGSDTRYSKILKSVDPEAFSRMLNGVSVGIAEYAKYWSSVYSLTTTEHYEALKEKFLDAEKSAEIIKNNDIVHYEIMPQVKNTLEKCMEKGVYVAILANSGIELSMGGNENSDLILAVSDVTGATTAPMGMRFADGFGGKGTVCGNPAHHHVSPSMEIDASTAFLPENTWFTDGGHHAMFQYESYGIELAAKTLCTDELRDVHSDPEFPQFMISKNPHRGIFAAFDNSLPGYITSADTALVVENIFKSNPVRILSVKADGMDISFEGGSAVLMPGQKAEFKFNGNLPEGSAVRTSVSVKYIKLDNISTVEECEFAFTVRGEGITFNDSEFVDDEFYTGDTSGMLLIQRILYVITNVIDFFHSIRDFLLSEAFKFLL